MEVNLKDNQKLRNKTYFSVAFNLILTECHLPYDLYVNSSSIEDREKFVKAFKAYDFLTKKDLLEFKRKHYQLYVSEEQRLDYLKTICSDKKDLKNILTLKSIAINHLETIFSNKDKGGLTKKTLVQSLAGCNETIKNIVNVLNSHNVDSLQDLIGNLSFHDFYTYDHSVNVCMYTVLLFKAVYPDATKDEIITAGISGLLHDLGKVKISTEILNGTNPMLPEADLNEIKKHPQFGYDLFQGIKLDYNSGINPYIVGRVILEHHENFNGTGYPNKVMGNNIHKIARICAIADFFDAVTTKRSYSTPLSVNEALALMLKHVGTKLDPEIFNIFIKLTSNFNPAQKSKINVTKDFDPCEATLSECFCSNESIKDDFGDICLIGKESEFKLILEKKKNNIRFIKKD